MVDFKVDPSKTALIIIDLQNCFVECYPISSPDGLVILQRLNRLAEMRTIQYGFGTVTTSEEVINALVGVAHLAG